MKKEVYSRYYRILMLNSVVEFPNTEELADFVSELVTRDYTYYLNKQKARNVKNKNKIAEIEERLQSEPMLVKNYAMIYLRNQIQQSSAKIKRFFAKKVKTPDEIVIDAEDSHELHDFVLERLGRCIIASEVFASATRYIIVGNTLKREIP